MRLAVALAFAIVVAPARAGASVDFAPVPPRPGAVPHLLYVDRCPQGCAIGAGDDDARADTSSVTSAGTLTALPRLDLAWASLLLCLDDTFAPYGLEVVTEEPAATADYVEIKIAGLPGDLGLAAERRSIAPIASDCTPLDHGLGFVFGSLWDLTDIVDAPVDLCGEVGHVAGHLLGLDHVLEAGDPMAAAGGGRRRFVDGPVDCGEDGLPRACLCRDSRQDDHGLLVGRLGVGAGEPPPHLTFVTPGDGDTVRATVTLEVEVDTARPVDHLELWRDGRLLAPLPGGDAGGRYTMRWVPDHLVGDHRLEVRAVDDRGDQGRAAIEVYWADDALCTTGGPATLAPTALLLPLLLRRRRRGARSRP
ncbi:MAG: Ig-like domain-containing protein [Kofleriaceae bacterium]|nr:Ig-like domain-containing protein [Kofleriaceae bacterium]